MTTTQATIEADWANILAAARSDLQTRWQFSNDPVMISGADGLEESIDRSAEEIESRIHSHAALVEALEHAVSDLHSALDGKYSMDSTCAGVANYLRVALASAKGTP